MDEMIELSGQLKAPTVVIDDVVYADTDTEAIKKVLEL
jgi:NADH:ubiquinone oxidoreductase subunit E